MKDLILIDENGKMLAGPYAEWATAERAQVIHGGRIVDQKEDPDAHSCRRNAELAEGGPRDPGHYCTVCGALVKPTNRYTVERADPHVRINIWPANGRMSGNPQAFIIVTSWNFISELEAFGLPGHIISRCRVVMADMDEMPF